MVCVYGMGQRVLISANDDFIGLRPYFKDKRGISKRQSKPFALSYRIMDNAFMPSEYLSGSSSPVFSLTVSSIKEA